MHARRAYKRIPLEHIQRDDRYFGFGGLNAGHKQALDRLGPCHLPILADDTGLYLLSGGKTLDYLALRGERDVLTLTLACPTAEETISLFIAENAHRRVNVVEKLRIAAYGYTHAVPLDRLIGRVPANIRQQIQTVSALPVAAKNVLAGNAICLADLRFIHLLAARDLERLFQLLRPFPVNGHKLDELLFHLHLADKRPDGSLARELDNLAQAAALTSYLAGLKARTHPFLTAKRSCLARLAATLYQRYGMRLEHDADFEKPTVSLRIPVRRARELANLGRDADYLAFITQYEDFNP